MREGSLVEEVPEFAIPAGPVVVADLEDPIFDPEGVVEVHPEWMLGEFGGPPLQITTVEELDPIALLRVRRRAGDRTAASEEQEGRRGAPGSEYGSTLTIQ